MDTGQEIKMQTAHLENKFGQLHLSEYVDILKRKKGLIILCVLMITSLVGIFSFLETPVYEGKAELFVEASSTPLSEVEQVGIQARQANDYYFDVVNHLLLSRDVLEEVVIRSRQDFPGLFDDERGQSPLSLLKKVILSPFQPETTPERTVEELLAREVKSYHSNVRVRPQSDYGVVTISVRNSSPELAAKLANLHVEVFIDKVIAKKKRELQEQFNWLAEQVDEQKNVVTRSYLDLYNYQKEHDLVLAERTHDLEKGKLETLGKGYLEAKTDRKFKEVVYNEIKDISTKDEFLFSIPIIAQDEIIGSLRNQLLSMKEQRAELAVVYGKKHSKMVEIEKKSNHLSREIKNEIMRVVQLSREEYQFAVSREETALKALEEQKHEALGLQETTFQHVMLSREAESNQALYQTLLTQWKQVSLVSMFNGENLHLTQPALVPKRPVSPRIVLNIALGAILSLFLGIALVFFLDYMDQKVRTPDDVVRYLKLQVLGSLPYDSKHEKNDLRTFAETQRGKEIQDPYSYGYTQVLDWLPQEMQGGGSGREEKIIQVISSATGEGKTTVLGKIAVRLAMAGYRVLAVDCDFQRPALHGLFSEELPGGLSDIMEELLSGTISAGQLSEQSVSDLFELISLKKLTGKLAVVHQATMMLATFRHGKVLNVESAGESGGDKIGTMLLKGGYLTESQLAESLARNKRTEQPFGYILLNSGYISRDILQGHLRLQTEENIQKLFSWKHGKYKFTIEPDKVTADEKISFQENYDLFINQLSLKKESILFDGYISKVTRETGYNNLSFISAGDSLPQPGDPVNFRLLSKLLTYMKDDYDLILVDGPPILEAPDAATLLQLVDGCVFVIKSGGLTYRNIQVSLTKISATGRKIIATVLNQVKS